MKLSKSGLVIDTGIEENDSDYALTLLQLFITMSCVKFRKRSIPAGAKIQHHQIRSIRPGNGLSPKEIDKVVGSTLMKEVSKGTPVSWDALER
jgi:flagella basal body P-ring formation protein FlgA